MNTNLVQSWLLYTTDKPMLVVGQQYRDDLTRSYQWDEKVYHHDSVNKGDELSICIRDKETNKCKYNSKIQYAKSCNKSECEHLGWTYNADNKQCAP